MEHCALPALAGASLSAAASCPTISWRRPYVKAGWPVWLAHDVEGSYEEGPPTLIESAKRDRRWGQGNLQHTWLLDGARVPPANRFHLLMVIAAN